MKKLQSIAEFNDSSIAETDMSKINGGADRSYSSCTSSTCQQGCSDTQTTYSWDDGTVFKGAIMVGPNIC